MALTTAIAAITHATRAIQEAIQANVLANAPGATDELKAAARELTEVRD